MFDFESLLWTYLAYIIAIIGIYALYVQIKKSKDISEGHLILNLNKNFIQNNELQDIYKKLQLYNNGNLKVFSEADIPKIDDYLSFFAVIYNLRDKNILSFDTLDSLFSTKFFLIINNPFVQKYLMEHKESNLILFSLYEDWMDYKKKQRKVEPFSENSLSIMIGRKNTLPKVGR